MTLRILTCSNTSFIVEGTKYLLRMSLKLVLPELVASVEGQVGGNWQE